MKPQELEKKLVLLCEKFGEERQALDVKITTDKHTCRIAVLFRLIKVEFIYYRKEHLFVPASTLYSLVYLHKNSPFGLHWPEVWSLLETPEYRAAYFPCIETEKRLEDCFEALTELLRQHLPQVEQVLMENREEDLLEKWLQEVAETQAVPFAQLAPLLRGDGRAMEQQRKLLEIHSLWLVGRYTTLSAYERYLWGDWEKALKKYEKLDEKGRIQRYERQLCEFMKQTLPSEFEAMKPECFAKKDLKTYAGGVRNGISWLKCFAILYIPFSALFCGLLYGLQQLYSAGALCWFGVWWEFGFLLAVLPAMFGVLAFRRGLTRLLEKKTADRQLAFDDIMNTERINKVVKGFFWAVLAAALLFSVYLSNLSLRLYEGWGDTGNESTLMGREPFSYEDINALYYIEGRYNDYEELLDRPSYVLQMKDGSLLDLDGYTTVEETEREALPIFKALGLQVQTVKTERDIPVCK